MVKMHKISTAMQNRAQQSKNYNSQVAEHIPVERLKTSTHATGNEDNNKPLN